MCVCVHTNACVACAYFLQHFDQINILPVCNPFVCTPLFAVDTYCGYTVPSLRQIISADYFGTLRKGLLLFFLLPSDVGNASMLPFLPPLHKYACQPLLNSCCSWKVQAERNTVKYKQRTGVLDSSSELYLFHPNSLFSNLGFLAFPGHEQKAVGTINVEILGSSLYSITLWERNSQNQ